MSKAKINNKSIGNCLQTHFQLALSNRDKWMILQNSNAIEEILSVYLNRTTRNIHGKGGELRISLAPNSARIINKAIKQQQSRARKHEDHLFSKYHFFF